MVNMIEETLRILLQHEMYIWIYMLNHLRIYSEGFFPKTKVTKACDMIIMVGRHNTL